MFLVCAIEICIEGYHSSFPSEANMTCKWAMNDVEL